MWTRVAARLGQLRTLALIVAAGGALLLPSLAVQPPAAAAVSSALKRYPYLTDAVGTYVTVNWATDRSATTGNLKWGRVDSTGSCTPGTSVPATRTGITVNTVAEYQWKATFSVGSSPEFCYRVYLSGGSVDLLGTDPTPRARPQVPAGSSQEYSFAVLGDTGEVDAGGTNAAQAAVMSHIADSGARFAVQTGDIAHPMTNQTAFGDLVQTGANTSAVFGPNYWTTAGARVPMFTVPGNHGITSNALLVNFPQSRAVSTSSGKYAMQTYCCVNGTSSQSQQSGWYAFDAGNARYYMLTAAWSDNNLGTASGTNRSAKMYQNDYDAHWAPGKPEYEWLKADLEAHAGTAVKMAFFHFPLYSDQSDERSDTYLQGASSLEGLLASNGVDIAFNGHAHIYQRNNKSPQGLVTYTTGGGGADLQSTGICSSINAYGLGWSDTNNAGTRCGAAAVPTSKAQVHHYLRVTVDGTNVTVTPVNQLGQTFDVKSYDFSGTPEPPADTTAPSAPTDLTATAASSTSVDLAWTAATDNVAVTGYDVFRNGAFLKSVTGTSTSDATVAASTSYTYTVKAKDEAGNLSPASDPAVVTTPGGGTGGTTPLNATADAQVQQANPTTNYGAFTTLAADQSSTAQVESYLKFGPAPAGTVTSATLRLWTTTGSSSGTTDGPAVHGVSTDWAEGTITWNTKPARAATATANTGAIAVDAMVEYDVTDLVKSGTYNFALVPDSSDGATFNSRTNSATTKRPQLIVTTG